MLLITYYNVVLIIGLEGGIGLALLCMPFLYPLKVILQIKQFNPREKYSFYSLNSTIT